MLYAHEKSRVMKRGLKVGMLSRARCPRCARFQSSAGTPLTIVLTRSTFPSLRLRAEGREREVGSEGNFRPDLGRGRQRRGAENRAIPLNIVRTELGGLADDGLSHRGWGMLEIERHDNRGFYISSSLAGPPLIKTS